MEIEEFIKELIGIGSDYTITLIEKEEEPEKIIHIYLKYNKRTFTIDGKKYKLYDVTPERKWQHLNWFKYKCYLHCSLPRYIDENGNPKVIPVVFSPPGKSYTYDFMNEALSLLKLNKVVRKTAIILRTTPYIITSIMEDFVEKGLQKRGFVENLSQISIDEKAHRRGHEYATIVMDTRHDYVLDMAEGRKEKSLKAQIYTITGKEVLPNLKLVNMDMWKPYMNVVKEIAPQAKIVHDKFHLIKMLTEAIDKTRKEDLKTNEDLKGKKYVFLRNKETMNDKQRAQFKEIDAKNLNTSKAWHIRENFKQLFYVNDGRSTMRLMHIWMNDSIEKNITAVNKVIETFKRHLTGIRNAINTSTSSGKHENMNGRIQALITKSKGYLNYERFRIHVLFHYGNLNPFPQNI